MSAIDVLAQAMYEASGRKAKWDSLFGGVQDFWREQAEVVAARMLEAEPAPTPPTEGTLEAAVDGLVTAAVQLNKVGRTKDLDPAEAVRLLDRIRYAIAQARYVDSLLVTHLYLHHEHGKTTYDDLGVVEVYRTRDRRAWDVRGVCQAVLDTRMAERGGEMPNDPWEVAEWILEVLPGGDPRLTPLRTLGLDPEAFHTSTPGNPTVKLPSRS